MCIYLLYDSLMVSATTEYFLYCFINMCGVKFQGNLHPSSHSAQSEIIVPGLKFGKICTKRDVLNRLGI